MITISKLLSAIKNLDFNTESFVDGIESGNYRSKFIGGGMEFSEVREYVYGDDVKKIDWNVSARHGGLFVKEFVEENDLDVFLLVDVSASNEFGVIKSKKERAFEISTSVIFSALRKNDQVGLAMFTNSLEKIMPIKKGERHMMGLLKTIIEHNPKESRTDVSNVITEITKYLKRKSMVFIISDFISDDFTKSLKMLKKHHKVIMINISDAHEEHIPDMGYVYLEDSESGKQILVNTSDKKFQEKYSELFEKAKNQKQQDLNKIGIDMINMENKENFEITFNRYFRNKGRR
mgnify:FL=1